MSWRWVAAGVLVALLVAGLAWRGRGAAPQAAAAVPVKSPPEVLGVGLLETTHEVPAAFEAAARIASLQVDEGERVKAGQLLGTLDPATPRRKLSVSEASRALARASVARAEADLERARVSKVSAARELARIDQLLAAAASTPAQRDQAEDRLSLTEAELRAAEAALTQAHEAERVALEGVQLQRQALADTRLVSPMDAVVVKRIREPGHFVAAGAPVFTLASIERLRVRAWVDETSLAALRPGQPARIELRSEPGRAYAGRVERVGRQADRQLHEVLVDVEVVEVPASYAFGQRADVHIAVGGERLARTGGPP